MRRCRETHEELGRRTRPGRRARACSTTTRPGRASSSRPSCCGAAPIVELHPHADEVAHAYRIGLAELCREDSPRFVSIPESDRPVVQVPLGGDLIHAPDRRGAAAVPLGRARRATSTSASTGWSNPSSPGAEPHRPLWPKPPPRSYAVEGVGLDPADLLDPLHDELGDAVAAVHLVRLERIGVEHRHANLARGSRCRSGPER